MTQIKSLPKYIDRFLSVVHTSNFQEAVASYCVGLVQGATFKTEIDRLLQNTEMATQELVKQENELINQATALLTAET